MSLVHRETQPSSETNNKTVLHQRHNSLQSPRKTLLRHPPSSHLPRLFLIAIISPDCGYFDFAEGSTANPCFEIGVGTHPGITRVGSNLWLCRYNNEPGGYNWINQPRHLQTVDCECGESENDPRYLLYSVFTSHGQTNHP